MLKYSDLSDEQRKLICNGCGVKGWIVKLPNFLFKASCNQHDFYYWRGCTELDRKLADTEFYGWMKADIEDTAWYLKPLYHIWAYAYYLAVRLFGSKYFSYGASKKSLDDLKKDSDVYDTK